MSKTLILKQDQRQAHWNKGRLIGQKRPLKPKAVWNIRARLRIDARRRDLAMRFAKWFAYCSGNIVILQAIPARSPIQPSNSRRRSCWNIVAVKRGDTAIQPARRHQRDSREGIR
jgi:hypothetical protein